MFHVQRKSDRAAAQKQKHLNSVVFYCSFQIIGFLDGQFLQLTRYLISRLNIS